MHIAGYVLAGGASSRMGTNKALLTLGERTLVEIAADAVRDAVGSVTIVGQPQTYGQLGLRVIADIRSNAGPLAGIETALTDTPTEWSLIVACDMPRLRPDALRRIVKEALDQTGASCVLPESASGFVEPLCAAYHKRLLPIISNALLIGKRKITDALPRDMVHHIRMSGDSLFQNVNTPEDWRSVALEH